MKRRPEKIHEESIEREIALLGERIADPSEQELRGMAKSAAAHPRTFRVDDGMRRAAFRPRLRWTGLAVAAALLVGSGLGFGLASSATPSGTAGTDVTGFGFLPARGWTVVQSGTVNPTIGANAVAANVPLHPDDDLEGIPYATLASLPPSGVLIHATFTTRGDPAQDVAFDAQSLPLDLSDATLASDRDPLISQRLGHRLRAGVGGYNIDTRIYYGTIPPSPRMVATGQRQLERLVVSSERVTIVAPPVFEADQLLTVSGSIERRVAGEAITIQTKDCGQRFFRNVAGTTTGAGGGWSIQFYPWITTTLRAVWRDSASAQITVRARATVSLKRRRSGRFEVWVVGKAQFWHKQVVIQQRRRGAWKVVRSVLLTDSGSDDPSGRTGRSWSRATFTPSVPKGTLIRAVLPLSQARPCYLAGISNPLRT